MAKYKILTLVGGISRGSINQKLFHALEDLSELELMSFDIARLPHFSQDLELEPPDVVTELKELIRDSHAVLFITPEYNRSIPGVLKNAIDWGNRPYGQNSWDKLPAAVVGASAGSLGTSLAQNHLRQVLMAVGMRTMPQPEVYINFPRSFDEAGQASNDKTKSVLEKFLKAFESWIGEAGQKEERAPLFNTEGPLSAPEVHH